MRNAVAGTIIIAEMAKFEDDQQRLGGRRAEVAHRPDPGRVTVAIFGDPIVGRALALVMQGARYDARFVPAEKSADRQGWLEGVRLLLLGPTPGLSLSRRDALVDSLRKEAMKVGIPMLELCYISREDTRPGRSTVPWPCTTEELEGHIEDALCLNHRP